MAQRKYTIADVLGFGSMGKGYLTPSTLQRDLNRKLTAKEKRKVDPVAAQVQKLFGMAPDVQRSTILPLARNKYTGDIEFAVPSSIYGLARSFVAPGVAASGQKINPEKEATDFALNFTGAGSAAGRLAPVKSGAVLGMSGAPKGLLSTFSKPGVEPIVTQAGRSGLRLADPKLLELAHASGGGSPFTSVKPRSPLDQFKFQKTDLGNLPAGEIVDPQSLQNAMLVSLYGDKTDALKAITNFGGIDVNVPLNAGPRFGAMQQALGGKAAWASEKTPVRLLRDRIAEGLDQGRDVYGIYTAMGPAAGDQTVDMANLIVQAAKGSKIKKADVKKFDDAMKKIAPEFPGIMDEDAMRFLQGQTQGVRKKMIDILDTAAFQDAGFPNVGAARIAITDENLLNAPAGSSGYSIVKFSPDTLSPMEPLIPHPSYGEQMAGEYIGQLPELVPFDLVFKDLIKQRRSQGMSAGSDLRSLELKKPNQVVDQETVDGIMNYISRLASQDK